MSNLIDFQSSNTWIWWCFVAIIFTGLRGFHRKRIASSVPSHQHVHLVATFSTMLIGGIFLFFSPPVFPENLGFFALICVLNGIGYALAGITNLKALQHLTISTFQSASKLSVFIPIIVFYFVLGESIHTTRVIGIMLAAFPILMLSLVEPSDKKSGGKENSSDVQKGVLFLVLYIGIASAMQIINVLAVDKKLDFTLGVSPFLFLVCTNFVACPAIILMITKAGERTVLTKRIAMAGVTSGFLNTIAFASFLIAIKLGPASSVVTLYAYNAFISVALFKAFPISAEAPRMSSRAKLIILFLVAWSAISIGLLILEPPQ